MGSSVGDGTLFTLYFPDNHIVLTGDEDDLGYMVRKFQTKYTAAGLSINTAKCEYLIVGREHVKDLILDAGRIRVVENNKYFLEHFSLIL